MGITAAKHPIGAQFENLKKLLTDIEPDAVSFDGNGKRAAGTRVRKAMQAVKTGAQGIRETVVQK